MSELINNRAQRIETLRSIIQQLHQGVPVDRVRQELVELVKVADAGEIAAMEQEIIASGVPVEEIKAMCDLHAQAVSDLIAKPTEQIPPGHPADTLKHENRAIEEMCRRFRAAVEHLATLSANDAADAAVTTCSDLLNELMDVDKHYRRKEDLFFSMLERHGITGPSKVMWAVHDEARKRLKAVEATLHSDAVGGGAWAAALQAGTDEALMIVERLVDKEENILLPMMLETLTEDEWGEIWSQSPRYGWCLVEPRVGYQPPTPELRSDAVEVPSDRAITFPTGQVDFDQIDAIFRALPVDLTFVDADDRVRFFSEGERIFARTTAIIGRKVQNCHPPHSVHIVNQIIDDFRGARQHRAEFWIELHGKFVHIRYFAVRSRDDQYLGTLEVTQDLTPLRALTGERRLLAYDSPTSG